MSKFLKIVLSIFTILIIIFLLLLRYCSPLLHNLPQPTGNYSVANTRYHWHITDQNINNPKYKTFTVEAFYPSNKQLSLKRFPYQLEKLNAIQEVMVSNSYLPTFIWKQLFSNILTFTEPNGPIADSQMSYPVIIYLPGIGSEDLHNVYLEELVSHGYVVFAIEPPYDVLAAVFPGNTIITIDPVLTQAIKENNRPVIYNYRNEAHQRWNSYIQATLQHLQKLNADASSLFYQKLNLDKIGLLGHSHGGAVALDFCQNNKICKAGINMDGWTKTYNSSKSFDTPFLLLLNEAGHMPEMEELLRNNQRDNFRKITIQGAGHDAFNDKILLKYPLNRLFDITTKNAIDIRKEISNNIVSFFNKYLRK